MSHIVQIPVIGTYGLVSYDSDYVLSTHAANLGNACDGNWETNAYLYMLEGKLAESYIWYNFPQINIPEDAYDINVSCYVKLYYGNNGGQNAATIQLYSGSTPMGTATDIRHGLTANTTHYVDMVCGTWTRSQLQNAKLKFYAQRYTYTGSGNASSSRFIRLYEADITVTYKYDEFQYEITCSSSDPYICIGTQSNYLSTYSLPVGTDLTINCIGSFIGDIVTDNGKNITPTVIGTTDGRLIQLTDIQSDHDIKIYVPAYVKSGNTWKKAKNMLIKQEGQWGMVQKTYIKDGGVWRKCVSELEFLNTDGFKKNFIIKR